MSESMVERVAKALHESMSQQDVLGYLDAKIDAAVLARAAIEAMREPTDAMILAFDNTVHVATEDTDALVSNPKEAFSAMIDAALKP